MESEEQEWTGEEDFQDSSKLDWVRRVHSSPLLEPIHRTSHQIKTSHPDRDSGDSYQRNCKRKLSISFSGKSAGRLKKTVSFDLCTFLRRLPRPDCMVQLGRVTFYCNRRLLEGRTRLRMPVNAAVPLVLHENNKVSRYSFWLAYHWLNVTEEWSGENFIIPYWVIDLYTAAVYLKIPDLEAECRRYLDGSEIKEERAFYLYTKLHQYDDPVLSERLLSTIGKAFLPLADCDEFHDLFLDELCQLLSCDNLIISGEVEVFYAGVHWVLEELEERGSYVEEVLSLARFPHMSLQQMLTLCREFPVFTSKSSLKHNIDQAVRLRVLLDESEDEEKRRRFEQKMPPSRIHPYKSFSKQPQSYKMFLNWSSLAREKARQHYSGGRRLSVCVPPLVQEFERDLREAEQAGRASRSSSWINTTR